MPAFLTEGYDLPADFTTTTVLSPETWFTGNFGRRYGDTSDMLRITVEEGQRYHVSADFEFFVGRTFGRDDDFNMTVFDADENIVATISTISTSEFWLQFTAETTGDYFVQVSTARSLGFNDFERYVVGFQEITPLQGTDLGDVLDGSNGYLIGLAGDDTLTGISGSNTILGGEGDDIIRDSGFQSILIGGPGNDTIHTAVNADFDPSIGRLVSNAYGGPGDDLVVVGVAQGIIDTGDGQDTVRFAPGSDIPFEGVIVTGADDDVLDLRGQVIRYSVDAGWGHDVIFAGGGELRSDVLANGASGGYFYGNAGHDRIYVETSYYTGEIAAGAGNDFVSLTVTPDDEGNAGFSNAVIYGGWGNDVLFVAGFESYGVVSVYGGWGADVISGGGLRGLLNGGDGDDTIRDGARNDTIIGGDGADDILVSGGNDSVDGGSGDDTIVGNSGNDTIFGGDGNDSINVQRDYLNIPGEGDPIGRNVLVGGAGDDTISGGWGEDTLWGGAGNDELSGGVLMGGGGGDDVLVGTRQASVLYGGEGNDTLNGENGDDTLYGGAGDDIIFGGAGSNLLNGGAGADVFVFEDRINFLWDGTAWIPRVTTNTFSDFAPGVDRIDLSQVSDVTDFADLLASHASETATGVRILLSDEYDYSLLLEGVAMADLSASDFVF